MNTMPAGLEIWSQNQEVYLILDKDSSQQTVQIVRKNYLILCNSDFIFSLLITLIFIIFVFEF